MSIVDETKALVRKQGTIGKPVSRLDGALKVKGEARFAAEFRFKGMVYAAVVCSTIARGRIVSIDTAATAAAPGVELVMTYRNAPRMRNPGVIGLSFTANGPADLPVMQTDQIHWNGQPVGCVLAETQEQADYAASLLVVEYEEAPATTTLEQAILNGTETGVFSGMPLFVPIGDADTALEEAPHRVDHVYRTPRHNHNAIEPHAVTLAWVDDELVIHDASQAIAQQAQTIAEVFGLTRDQVHLTSPYVGGGFGGKMLWDHQIIAAAAAKLAGRPVRLTLTREGVYRLVGGRALTEQRVAIGADADGRFNALIHSGVSATTAYNKAPEPFILGTLSAYASPDILLHVQVADMDMRANCAMRAPGEAAGSFALESAIDELAIDLGIDPMELRLRNEPEKNPVSGLPFSSRHGDEAWRKGAARFGWSERHAPGTRCDGEWLIGTGCAGGGYPYVRMPGAEARLTLTCDGGKVRARVAVAGAEMGMGTSTTTAMIVSEQLALPLDSIEVLYGDSAIPGAVMAAASQQMAAIGGAVIAAHRTLLAELLKLAGNDSPLAGLSPVDVVSDDECLARADDLTIRESYASIMTRAKRDTVSVAEAGTPPIESEKWSIESHSAIFCEVRVNAVTGEIRVSRVVGAFDCGRILNPKTAASQFRGGIIMGLGMALMEETQFDERNGRIMNPSLAEYHVPVHMDVPEIDVVWTDIADPNTPMGARGVGEIGITGVAAAVANAVFNATGKRIRDLPITLDKLL